jgi:predicted nucleic acid-binding protein
VIVLDTSALVNVVVNNDPELEERIRAEELHAPHLVDVELVHALRRLVATEEILDVRATEALANVRRLAIDRYPHGGLVDRMWELRDNFTAHDACFVALSEALGAPLVTSDGRLARAPGHRATIELYERPI